MKCFVDVDRERERVRATMHSIIPRVYWFQALAFSDPCLRSLHGIYWYSCLIWFRFCIYIFLSFSFFSLQFLFLFVCYVYICRCACVCLPFATIFFFFEPLSSIYITRENENIYVRVFISGTHYNYSALIISYKLCAHNALLVIRFDLYRVRVSMCASASASVCMFDCSSSMLLTTICSLWARE